MVIWSENEPSWAVTTCPLATAVWEQSEEQGRMTRFTVCGPGSQLLPVTVSALPAIVDEGVALTVGTPLASTVKVL
jgi:hypothetical protein